jgi:uncharacterized protein involved in tolerance to divalent cations
MSEKFEKKLKEAKVKAKDCHESGSIYATQFWLGKIKAYEEVILILKQNKDGNK